MDGLEMCRTVRSMDKFRQLPIIMISGQDTLVDKLKGQIAGTNHYLIKPFDPEKLLELVNQYVSVGNT
jgi:twitching motility two-component system response regulator PilG